MASSHWSEAALNHQLRNGASLFSSSRKPCNIRSPIDEKSHIAPPFFSLKIGLALCSPPNASDSNEWDFVVLLTLCSKILAAGLCHPAQRKHIGKKVNRKERTAASIHLCSTHLSIGYPLPFSGFLILADERPTRARPSLG